MSWIQYVCGETRVSVVSSNRVGNCGVGQKHQTYADPRYSKFRHDRNSWTGSLSCVQPYLRINNPWSLCRLKQKESSHAAWSVGDHRKYLSSFPCGFWDTIHSAIEPRLPNSFALMWLTIRTELMFVCLSDWFSSYYNFWHVSFVIWSTRFCKTSFQVSIAFFISASSMWSSLRTRIFQLSVAELFSAHVHTLALMLLLRVWCTKTRS